MTNRWVLRGVWVLAISGCAVGPDYQKPPVTAPTAWKTPQTAAIWKEATPRDTQSRGKWWEIFADAELNALEEQALAHNQEVQVALARVMRAKAATRQVEADWQPILSAAPSYEHYQRTRSNFGGSGTFGGDSYRIPFDLSYELDLWGKVRRSFEAAQAESEAGQAAYHAVLLTLTAEVARHYLFIRALDTEWEVVQRTLDLRRRALDLVTKRLQAGVVNELDVARAKTELATVESDAVDLQRRRAEFENTLAVLCGQLPEAFSVAAKPLVLVPPAVPVGLPSALLERRPDVAEAERAMAAANARIGVAVSGYFPAIRLTGAGGVESAEVDMLFDEDSYFWSLGPSLAIPLFAGGRNQARVQAARAQYDEAVARYRQQVLVAFREVEDALINLRLRAEQAETHQRVLDAARETAQLSHTRYTQGIINYLEVVDAERSQLQAEREAVNILNQRLLATVLLVKALGGSWGDPQLPKQ
jgi:multidrug efflux system outer membrane protein